MADKVIFTVVRRHDGDRTYDVGETREGTMAELGHLVPKVLVPASNGVKAERSPQNKAEGAAPANKAATGRGRKKGA